MQHRADVERDGVVGAPVAAQVQMAALAVAADVQLGEVAVGGGAHELHRVALGDQCGPDRVEDLAGAASERGEQVDVLRGSAQQAVRGQRVPAGQREPTDGCGP